MSTHRHKLAREVQQLFDEYFSYSANYERIRDIVERVGREAGAGQADQPFFWDLLMCATGPKVLKRLLQIFDRHKIDLNERDVQKRTCLHRLIQWHAGHDMAGRQGDRHWQSAGLRNAIHVLVQKGADPSLCDDRGNNILMLSLYNGLDADSISLIADLTGGTNSRNAAGSTALQIAITTMNEEAIRILLLKGANPFQKDEFTGNILHHVIEAVERNDRPFTPFLMEIISDYHKSLRDLRRNSDGQIPLMLLCSGQSLITVPDGVFEMLIPSKSVINETCDEGHSCLSYVIQSNFRDEKLSRIEKLVKAGAEITAGDLNTAIHYGSRVLQKLLELGAKPGVQHLKESLSLPQASGNMAFKVLVRAIPPFNLADEYPAAACDYLRHFLSWHMADELVDSDFMLFLIREYGLDVNYNDPEYGTLIHVMSHRPVLGNVTLFDRLVTEYGNSLLLDLKAKRDPSPYWITEPDPRLTTPLQIAIEMNCFTLAARLVQNFASIENLDLTKFRSSTYDSDSQFYQLVQILLLAGVPAEQLLHKVEDLKQKYADSGFDLLTKSGPVPSLAEQACVTLRRNLTRSDAVNLLQSVEFRPKIQEYLFLRHVPVVSFPHRDIYFDEDFDEDDDDFYDDASDDIDGWGDDYDDSDVEAFIFFD